MVIYRVSPDDVQSGVTVGDLEYPGLSRPKGVARAGRRDRRSGRARRVLRAQVRPAAEHAHLPVRARRGRQHARAAISTSGRFRSRSRRAASRSPTSCSIAWCRPSSPGTTEVKPAGSTDRAVPRDQRRAAAKERGKDRVVRRARPRLKCCGAARCSSRSATPRPKSAFADQRTYLYQGKEVDHQVHLGFDLASFAGTPIVAANRGQGALRRGAGHLRPAA